MVSRLAVTGLLLREVRGLPFEITMRRYNSFSSQDQEVLVRNVSVLLLPKTTNGNINTCLL